MSSTGGQKYTSRLENTGMSSVLYGTVNTVSLISLYCLVFAWKAITAIGSVSTSPCLERCRIILHLVILLAFSIWALTMFISLVESHCFVCSDNGFSVLQRCRDDCDICADHPGAWLLFKTLFSPEAFGRWEEVIYISSSRWKSWPLKRFFIFLPASSSELANKAAALLV